MIPHFDAGGDVSNIGGFGGVAPTVSSSGPLQGDMMRRFQSMTPEQLQEMSIRLGNSPMGGIAQRVLMQKRMVPAAQTGAAQQPAQGATGLAIPQAPQAPSLAQPQQMQQMARGGVPKLAMGGMPFSSADTPWWTRSDARDIGSAPQGFMASSIGGRTDHIASNPMVDSFVIPADVVSGLGEGNSLAGARMLDAALSTGPHGIPMPRGGMHHTMPSAPRPYAGESTGGRVTRPAMLAGGEYVVQPHQVAAIGGGDMKRGHEVLRRFVLTARKKSIKDQTKLAGPVMS